jgi:outer membrane protein
MSRFQVVMHSWQLLPLSPFFVSFSKIKTSMLNKTPILALFALLLGATTINAQAAPKYGHMNLGNLLELLPDTKKANDDLKVFADKLTAKDDSLTKAFQVAVTEYQNAYQTGTLTPVQAQTREAELQKDQEAIQKFEQEAQQMVATKREELLKPILTKVDEAIKAVALENQYMMIFDTSSGSMLFAAETEDVTALVKKKLGI